MQNNLLMQNFVLNLLRNNLPEKYYYHNPEHTIYVQERALEIGKHEECTEDDLKLLSAAALWHDTGYIRMYAQHEEQSCIIARQYLPEYGYSASVIDQICGMIMATKIPQLPKTKLEEILADADLEYLGTESFEKKSYSLFLELQSLNPSLTEAKWNLMQISFLQKHHYFTRFCKENREPIKQIYLNKLVNGIE
ncbi:MAG TPA: HD family phosphohydrolase [Prolixibacteraceae bacterium]|nr:HD family phosphohydrolase [Prolixibacteraceae bacterium]